MQKENELNFSKGNIIWIGCLIIFVPAIFGLIACYMIFGDLFIAFSKMWAYKGKPNTTASSITSLSYIFTILISFYTLCTTTLFSFLVYRVSKSGLSVSKKLKDLENKRDEEIVRENALIVYYDLQRGISNLKDLYLNYVLIRKKEKPNRIYFSTDWIKNVANLRDQLTEQELNAVYKLYEQFHALQNILEKNEPSKSDEELKQHLVTLSKEVFANFIPLEILVKHSINSANELVNIDLYIILKKIYYLTFTSSKRVTTKVEESDGKITYKTELDGTLFFEGSNEEIFVGTGKLYNTNEEIKCSGKFYLKQFSSGMLYGYYAPGYRLYQTTYDISIAPKEFNNVSVYQINNGLLNQYFYQGQFKNGKLYNGITTLFGSKNEIIYQGKVVDGIREGNGTSYIKEGQREFEGIWKGDLPYNGVLFQGDEGIFKGTLNKNRKPWDGETKNFDLSSEVKYFTGTICKGKPITGIGYILHVKNMDPVFEKIKNGDKYQIEHFESSSNFETSEEVSEQKLEEVALTENNLGRLYGPHNEFLKAEWKQTDILLSEKCERNIKIYSATD
ncbi:MORN repeat-containing protein [Bacillus cereus]